MGREDEFSDDRAFRDRPHRWDDERRSRLARAYPAFCLTVFILDIVFCTLRLIMAPIGALGVFAMQQKNANPELLFCGLLEVVSHAAVGGVGLLAAILMLMRKKFGAILAWLTAVLTLLGFGISLWQLFLTIEDRGFQPGTPEFVGALFGGGCVLMIRAGLLVLYLVAVVLFVRLPDQPARTDYREED